MLCAISNIQSGDCSEDCKYCNQSAFVKTNIPKFKQKSIDEIVREAQIAHKNHALGFCLVTAGLGFGDKKRFGDKGDLKFSDKNGFGDKFGDKSDLKFSDKSDFCNQKSFDDKLSDKSKFSDKNDLEFSNENNLEFGDDSDLKFNDKNTLNSKNNLEFSNENAHKFNDKNKFTAKTATSDLDDDKLDYVCRAAYAVRKAQPNLMLIACNGLATLEQLKELKKVGFFSYNHNLETSREFFPQICTTHSWESRFETNLRAKEAGLALCCGGIYGLGESEKDRESFRKSLAELKPFTSPVNFFVGNENLRIKPEKLSVDEALKIIEDSKKALGDTHIMIAGGREAILGERQYEVFGRGASAVVIGDYLTTNGEVPSTDIAELEKMGFSFANECH